MCLCFYPLVSPLPVFEDSLILNDPMARIGKGSLDYSGWPSANIGPPILPHSSWWINPFHIGHMWAHATNYSHSPPGKSCWLEEAQSTPAGEPPQDLHPSTSQHIQRSAVRMLVETEASAMHCSKPQMRPGTSSVLTVLCVGSGTEKKKTLGLLSDHSSVKIPC